MTLLDLDAQADQPLGTDVLIVGAGPAGLATALRLSAAGIEVLLLDSGSRTADAAAQSLNEGTTSGDDYLGLAATRHRQLGGTSGIWNTPVGGSVGAKYAPLDPIDFLRGDRAVPGWPIGLGELEPFYREAQSWCQLGPFRYEGSDWFGPTELLATGAAGVTTRVYHFGPRSAWTDLVPRTILARGSARIGLGLTATALHFDPTGARVIAVTAVDRAGRAARIEARRVVLAAGAIENARLLLVAGIGERLDWVGRGFMEHPRDRSLVLIPASRASYELMRCYDVAPDRGVGGRLALTEAVIREAGLPNASASLFPGWREGWLARLARRSGTAGYGWARRRNLASAFDRFELLINLEQRPHRDNRITLGGDRDALGVLRPHLHWTWRPDDAAGLDQLRGVLTEALEGAGAGRVVRRPAVPPDPNAHHHAGTTRMAIRASDGVVDPDGLVFGTENLFVAGASTFPFAGFANPTLTIVALGLRLGAHLAAEAGGGE